MSEFPEQIGTEWLFDAHIDLAPPENIGGRLPAAARSSSSFAVSSRGAAAAGSLTLANGGELDV